MAGTLDVVVEELSFGERRLGVAAPVPDGIDVVVDPEEGNAIFTDVDTQTLTLGDLVDSGHSRRLHHTRPSACASMNFALRRRLIGSTMPGTQKRSSASSKKPRS